mgnify:CR=1 FL=1
MTYSCLYMFFWLGINKAHLVTYNQSGLTRWLKCIGKVVHIIDKMCINMSAPDKPHIHVYFLCWYGPGKFLRPYQIRADFSRYPLALKALRTYCTGIHVAAMCRIHQRNAVYISVSWRRHTLKLRLTLWGKSASYIYATIR